jgi:hypothetical protein
MYNLFFLLKLALLHFLGYCMIFCECISVVNWKMHRHRTIKIQKCSSGSQFIHWNLLSLFKCLSHRKSCNIPKNVTKLISVRKKGYTFSKYLMPSILKYINRRFQCMNCDPDEHFCILIVLWRCIFQFTTEMHKRQALLNIVTKPTLVQTQRR